MTSQSVATRRKLPFWRTVAACYLTVGRNFGQLIRMSWLWLLIMLPVYAAVYWLSWPLDAGAEQAGAGQSGTGFVTFAISSLPNIVEIPALASIAVAWHRLVLHGERVRGPFYLRLDGVVWLYALILLALLVVALGPFLCAVSFAGARPEGPDSLAAVWALLSFIAVGFVVAFLLLPRLSLVLPAIAVGEQRTLWDVWRASRGNTWRLAGASLLCSLPPLIPSVVLLQYAEPSARARWVIASTVSSLTYVLITTIAVTLLSLAYRHLVWQRPTGDEAQT